MKVMIEKIVCPLCKKKYDSFYKADECMESCVLETYSEQVYKEEVEVELKDKALVDYLDKLTKENLIQAAKHPNQIKLQEEKK